MVTICDGYVVSRSTAAAAFFALIIFAEATGPSTTRQCCTARGHRNESVLHGHFLSAAHSRSNEALAHLPVRDLETSIKGSRYRHALRWLLSFALKAFKFEADLRIVKKLLMQ